MNEKEALRQSEHGWNALATCGMKIEELHEEVNSVVLNGEDEFSERYYSIFNGKRVPLSFIIKAVKL